MIAERALRGAEDAGKKVTLTCGAGVAARGKGDAPAGAGWGAGAGWWGQAHSGGGRRGRERGRPARGGGERAGPQAIGLESRRAALGQTRESGPVRASWAGA